MTAASRLFAEKMTAADVKFRLRAKHPATPGVGDGPGAWTCLEEFHEIDLLAICAWTRWKGFFGENPIIGYEVKVSRSDYRTELLSPHKRAGAVAFCTQFYFAVPAGLLTGEEIAFEEPEWFDKWENWQRERCPGVDGRICMRDRRKRASGHWVERERTPEEIAELDDGFGVPDHTRHVFEWQPCATCGGKGYLRPSRVEREAPTLWVPRDVGLVEVNPRGCRVVRPAPHRTHSEWRVRTIAQMVRWASFRPDPRHRA